MLSIDHVKNIKVLKKYIGIVTENVSEDLQLSITCRSQRCGLFMAPNRTSDRQIQLIVYTVDVVIVNLDYYCLLNLYFCTETCYFIVNV